MAVSRTLAVSEGRYGSAADLRPKLCTNVVTQTRTQTRTRTQPQKKFLPTLFLLPPQLGAGLGPCLGAGQPLAGRHAALPAPLTQRRRSDARRRHPRLRRRELHAARATARSRLDQVRHRQRTPTSALRTPARRRPSDRHSPRACRAAAGASTRAAAGALITFSLDDKPEVLLGARSRPAEPARQPADSHTRAFRRGAAALHSTVARVERVRVGRPP